MITTLSAAQAAVNGIRAMMAAELDVRSLQAHYDRGTADHPVFWQLLSHVLYVNCVRSVWGECTVSISVAGWRWS